MSDRIDFWRGFAGGMLTGIVVGAFTYFSAKNPNDDKTITLTDHVSGREITDSLHLNREAPEQAGDPAKLLPNIGNFSRVDFERPDRPV
jgi:hypothetical protein